MKVGILLFEQFYGKENIGSSRIRGRWLAKHWEDAEVFKMGQEYDAIIFQKVYWIEYARLIRKQESKCDCVPYETDGPEWNHQDNCNSVKPKKRKVLILDICDADWMHWGHRVKQMIDLCDAVTTSSVELAKFIVTLTDKPVWCIPDRLAFEELRGGPKKHVGDTATVAWFGYSENFPMLDAAINGLIREGIKKLIVIASRKTPYTLPPFAQSKTVQKKDEDGKMRTETVPAKIELVNYPWTLESVNDDLLRADVVINPQSKFARWKYKSNNKTITAWALGLPVAHTIDELHELMTAEVRNAEATKRLAEVHEKYDIAQSVVEYKNLIQSILDSRKIN